MFVYIFIFSLNPANETSFPFSKKSKTGFTEKWLNMFLTKGLIFEEILFVKTSLFLRFCFKTNFLVFVVRMNAFLLTLKLAGLNSRVRFTLLYVPKTRRLVFEPATFPVKHIIIRSAVVMICFAFMITCFENFMKQNYPRQRGKRN